MQGLMGCWIGQLLWTLDFCMGGPLSALCTQSNHAHFMNAHDGYARHAKCHRLPLLLVCIKRRRAATAAAALSHCATAAIAPLLTP